MPSVYLALLFSVLSFTVSIFSFIFFRSYLNRRTSQERILAEIQEEVNSILKSIDETTDRDISLIEEREKNLKSLLEEIDKRLKVYIREIHIRREAEDAFAALSPKPPDKSSPAQGERTYQELGKNRYRLEEAGHGDNSNPAFPLPRFRVKQGSSSEPRLAETAGIPETVSPPPSVDDQIRELIRAGFTAPVIASRLGISISQVEFAEALMERRGS